MSIERAKELVGKVLMIKCYLKRLMGVGICSAEKIWSYFRGYLILVKLVDKTYQFNFNTARQLKKAESQKGERVWVLMVQEHWLQKY